MAACAPKPPSVSSHCPPGCSSLTYLQERTQTGMTDIFPGDQQGLWDWTRKPRTPKQSWLCQDLPGRAEPSGNLHLSLDALTLTKSTVREKCDEAQMSGKRVSPGTQAAGQATSTSLHEQERTSGQSRRFLLSGLRGGDDLCLNLFLGYRGPCGSLDALLSAQLQAKRK